MVYDEIGNAVADDYRHASGLGQTTSKTPTDQFSLGAAIWEFFHPSQVQAEQVATGQPVQTTSEVLSSAAGEAFGAAQETASNIGTSVQNIASGAQTLGKYLVVGVVAVAILAVLSRLPKR